MRETLEEINVLIARPIDGKYEGEIFGCREEYLKDFNSDFLEFCKAKKLIPDLEQIFGYRRVSTGMQIVPGIDNQMYLYFTKNNAQSLE